MPTTTAAARAAAAVRAAARRRRRETRTAAVRPAAPTRAKVCSAWRYPSSVRAVCLPCMTLRCTMRSKMFSLLHRTAVFTAGLKCLQ
jgi:hypothetical protein